MERPGFVEPGVMRLPPGFRFHPTDEELVVHYLRRKVLDSPLPASVIPEVDLDKYDPWDLPGVVEGERYFFDLRGLKYRARAGNRPDRATRSGYWKAIGKEKQIRASGCNQLVGVKRVLVFHRGKPGHGSRTDWIMHEYRLAGHHRRNSNHDSMVQTKGWVACRIFKKKRATKLETEIMHGYKRRARNNRLGIADHTRLHGSDSGPPSPSSSSSSCVTDLSEETSDGEDGGSTTMASCPNGREA